MAQIRTATGAVALLAALAVATPALAGDPRCAQGNVSLQEHRSRKGDIVLELPESWDCDVRELADGVVVTDRNEGCVLEFLRSPGLVSIDEAVQLYESLYLGNNRLDDECAKAVSGSIGWADTCLVREYRPRARGRTIQALFAHVDGEIVVALLKCDQPADKAADWVSASAIFNSYRKPVGHPFRWSAGSGLLGPLYFLMKIPFNRFQNPD